MEELGQAVTAAGIDLTMVRGAWGQEESCSEEPLQLCLLRFLRANAFNVPKALIQLEKNVVYRLEQGVHELVRKTPREVLGCDPEKVNCFYPRWLLCHDRLGRPVLAKQYGGLKLWELTEITTLSNMVRSHVWEQEMVLRLMRERTAETGVIVDTSVIIIDTKGLTLRHEYYLLWYGMCHVKEKKEGGGARPRVHVPEILVAPGGAFQGTKGDQGFCSPAQVAGAPGPACFPRDPGEAFHHQHPGVVRIRVGHVQPPARPSHASEDLHPLSSIGVAASTARDH
ncbi:unnamed protein product [Discosporangium mesarthrocarpum]